MKNAKAITLLISLVAFSCSTAKKATTDTTSNHSELIGTWELQSINTGHLTVEVEESLTLTFHAPKDGEEHMTVVMQGPCSRRSSTLTISANGKLHWGEFNQPVEACDVLFEEDFLSVLQQMVRYDILASGNLAFTDGKKEKFEKVLWFYTVEAQNKS